MAHVPMGDIRELWKENGDHSWKGLHRTLEARKGKTGGISNDDVLMMLRTVDRLEKDNTPYPDSDTKLYDLMNKQLQQQFG